MTCANSVLPTFIGVSGQPNAGTLPNAGHAVQIGDILTIREMPLFTGFAKKHFVFNRTLLIENYTGEWPPSSPDGGTSPVSSQTRAASS